MAEILRRVILLVLSHHCYDEFFINFNFFDGPCLKATLSKILGLGIIAGSVMGLLVGPIFTSIVHWTGEAGTNKQSKNIVIQKLHSVPIPKNQKTIFITH